MNWIRTVTTSVAAVVVAAPTVLAGQDCMSGSRSTIGACAPGSGSTGRTPMAAQRSSTPWGSQFWIPFGSLVAPGLGQYLHHAPWEGLAHTGAAVAGLAIGSVGDSDPVATGTLPRRPRNQLSYQGYHVAGTAGFLSAWDAFHRAVPALKQEGRYQFLPERESLGDLLTAPFDASFLRRRTTLVHLAFTGLITGVVLSSRGDGEREPFRWHDAAFASSLSLNAGVGEEAAFRGWLLPMFHQKVGRRFWVANTLQAGIFGVGHLPQAEEFALVITAWAGYEGWLTRRNDWSIRESIFHHFWYDVAVVVATLLADDQETRLQFSLPAPGF